MNKSKPSERMLLRILQMLFQIDDAKALGYIEKRVKVMFFTRKTRHSRKHTQILDLICYLSAQSEEYIDQIHDSIVPK